MPTRHDAIDDIPPIIPQRDEGTVSGGPAGRGRTPPGAGGGAGLWARLFITLGLVVAAVACAWAWQLQLELERSTQIQRSYEARIADLEDRLSDTDEGMSQSTTAMAVKIKELYSEVDKLWASAWRRNKAKIADLEKSATSHASTLALLQKTDKDYSAQLQKLAADMKALQAVAGDLERIQKTATASEAQLERLGDDLNRLNLEFAKLQRRVGVNEEWVESNNNYRKTVNRNLSDLNTRLNEIQGVASP
jgi:chromosome segregation ATPase